MKHSCIMKINSHIGKNWFGKKNVVTVTQISNNTINYNFALLDMELRISNWREPLTEAKVRKVLEPTMKSIIFLQN